jgi:hypothetical protein
MKRKTDCWHAKCLGCGLVVDFPDFEEGAIGKLRVGRWLERAGWLAACCPRCKQVYPQGPFEDRTGQYLIVGEAGDARYQESPGRIP